MERIRNVQHSGLADEVIIEEYEGQKVQDIQKYDVDIFAIGSDWLGKFDYLNDYCKVVYLDRTKGVSSTQLRDETGGILQLGVIGSGRIANRLVGRGPLRQRRVSVEGVYSDHAEQRPPFADAPRAAVVGRLLPAAAARRSTRSTSRPPTARHAEYRHRGDARPASTCSARSR